MGGFLDSKIDCDNYLLMLKDEILNLLESLRFAVLEDQLCLFLLVY